MRTTSSLPSLLALLLVTACSSSSANQPSENPNANDLDLIATDTACDEWTTNAHGECMTFNVPLHWQSGAQNQSEPKIPFFVRRFAPEQGRPSRGDLWLVAGGPGEGGATFNSFFATLRTALPDVTFFIPDHRGTGRSARLGCAPTTTTTETAGGDGSPACLDSLLAKYGADGITGFSTTEAARDLAHAIDRLRTPKKPTYVYAVSYGTYLANRYLNLFPSQVDGVIMDGICPASGCADLSSNPPDVIGRRYLAACANDAFCKEKMGPDPAARLEKLYADLDSGTHCTQLTSAGLSSRALKGMFSSLLDDPERRELIVPLIYRLARCAPSDLAAFGHFGQSSSFMSPSPEESGYSSPLLSAIAKAEFFPPQLDLAALEASRVESALFADAQTVQAASASLALTWPTYDPGPNAHAWASTSIPLLLLNGTLDAQTPDYRLDEARKHFSAPNQRMVLIPNAPHASLLRSQCSLDVVTSWLNDPTSSTKETSAPCLTSTPPIDFRGTPEKARRFFGTEDLYD